MKTNAELTEESRRIVQTLYDAAMRGDAVAMFGLLDEDFVCHESPSLPYGRTYRGHQGLQELLTPLTQYLVFEELKVDYLIADGERVVAMVRLPVRSTGIETLVSEHNLVRNGKVVEQRVFFFEPTAVR